MYYVPHPTETAQYIQTMLLKEDIQKEKTFNVPPPIPKNNIPTSLNPEEVGYDIRNTVRDVLR
jgi:hypothetical protein